MTVPLLSLGPGPGDQGRLRAQPHPQSSSPSCAAPLILPEPPGHAWLGPHTRPHWLWEGCDGAQATKRVGGGAGLRGRLAPQRQRSGPSSPGSVAVSLAPAGASRPRDSRCLGAVPRPLADSVVVGLRRRLWQPDPGGAKAERARSLGAQAGWRGLRGTALCDRRDLAPLPGGHPPMGRVSGASPSKSPAYPRRLRPRRTTPPVGRTRTRTMKRQGARRAQIRPRGCAAGLRAGVPALAISARSPQTLELRGQNWCKA